MLFGDLVPGSFVKTDESQETLNFDYDWQNDKQKYQESQIREMSSYIKTKKDELTTDMMILEENVDVNTFSDMKKPCI